MGLLSLSSREGMKLVPWHVAARIPVLRLRLVVTLHGPNKLYWVWRQLCTAHLYTVGPVAVEDHWPMG